MRASTGEGDSASLPGYHQFMRDFRAMFSCFSFFVLSAAVAVTFATPACQRTRPENGRPNVPPPMATPGQPPSAPGEVGPLGSDCYETKHAKACPADPSDPSGRKLPAHGGPCQFPNCRPCGSKTELAFRDEHGAPSRGFCICVPLSDSSGKGTLTCYGARTSDGGPIGP